MDPYYINKVSAFIDAAHATGTNALSDGLSGADEPPAESGVLRLHGFLSASVKSSFSIRRCPRRVEQILEFPCYPGVQASL